MPLSNEYIVSFRCEKNQKLFNILHRMSPLLKIASLAFIILAIFNLYFFILASILFICSIIINYLKWYLVFNFEYVIKKNFLTIKKTYNYIKPKIYLQTKIEDINLCEIVENEQIEDTTDSIICCCYNNSFDVYIRIQVNQTNYILLADNYFYSLLKKMEDK